MLVLVAAAATALCLLLASAPSASATIDPCLVCAPDDDDEPPPPEPPPPTTTTTTAVPAPPSAVTVVARMLELANAARRDAGAGPLALRDDVSAIARGWSERMAAAGSLAHNDDYFAESVRRRLGARALGENVAFNRDVDDAHRRLMASPGHRANLLDRRYSVVGIGAVLDRDGTWWFTQDFVEPAPVHAPAPVAAPRPATPPQPRPGPVVRAAAPAEVAAAPVVELAVAAPLPPAVEPPAVARPRPLDDAPVAPPGDDRRPRLPVALAAGLLVLNAAGARSRVIELLRRRH